MDEQANLEATRVASLLEGWSEHGHGTLARRLAHALRGAVGAGLLPDGARLPAERALAEALAVSRSTVTAALDELREDGTVSSRQGSGTQVHGLRRASTAGTRIAEHFSPNAGIDLAAGNPPDASHLPPISIDVATLLAGGEGPGVQPLGLPALREALADRHSAHGRHTEPAEIHVTAGAHHATAIVLGTLVGPGAGVAVDDLSYPGIFDILDALGANPVPVRTDAAGMVPDELDRVLTQHRPTALYVQGGPHNPTGRAPVPARLRALAEVLDRHDVTVVEDGALADLTFDGRVRPELADLCRRAVVVSVGSVSKVCWGGLRIGWFRAPVPLVERTKYFRLAHDLGASVPAQLIVLQLLPVLDEIAAGRRAVLRETVDRALEVLGSELAEWQVVPPGGGSVLWARLPVPDAGPFVLLAGRHGVHVAPGSIATPGRAPDPHVRICVDRPWPVVEAGLDRLRLAWRELSMRPGVVLG